MYPNTKLLISGIIGKSEREQTDMPHAILRVTNMTGIIVREFYLSFPEDLQRRFFSMFSGIGLKPLMNAGGEVKFEDFGEGVEIHALLNWVESSGYVLMHTSETALSEFSHSHTFIFRKQTIIDRL